MLLHFNLLVFEPAECSSLSLGNVKIFVLFASGALLSLHFLDRRELVLLQEEASHFLVKFVHVDREPQAGPDLGHL